MLDKTLHDFEQVPCVLNSHNGDGIIYRKKNIHTCIYTHTYIQYISDIITKCFKLPVIFLLILTACNGFVHK